MLRDARPEDAVTLAALAAHVWLDTYATAGVNAAIAGYVLAEYSPDKFRALLDREGASVLVFERDAHLLGYAVLRNGVSCPCPQQAAAELATLYVQQRFAGYGIGTSLFSAACDRASGGRTSTWVAVNTHNVRAINFYRKQGMVEVGTTWFELDGTQHENHVFAFVPL